MAFSNKELTVLEQHPGLMFVEESQQLFEKDAWGE
jgi:hypothetical protein